MKINIAMFALVLALVACGNGEAPKIKAALRDNLKDPSSVEFGTILISNYGEFACIEYNAKNGFGGYVGMHIAFLNKEEGEWNVMNMDAYASNCEMMKKL